MESNQTLLDSQRSTKKQRLENINKEQQKANVECLIDPEYFCLVCNQLFTSKDIFNHLQQNKEHLSHCIDVNKIKNQLLDINKNIGNSNNNDNIFTKRIETLWSSLKSLSATHSSLNSKIDEISNHFKIYYDYLMSKEHSLKKEIQDEIDLINNDITHQISELKSIINIINSLNNNNSSDDSMLKNTHNTNNNPSSSIIESIQQSESYNNFFENNKDTLFYNNNIKEYNSNNNSAFLFFLDKHNSNFNSGVLNPTEINSQSKNVNENLHIIKVKQQDHICKQLQKISEESIIIKSTPSALFRFGDLERIKQYYKRNNITFEYNHNSTSKKQIKIKEAIIEVLKSNRIDILKYFIKELYFDIRTEFKPDLLLFKKIKKIDLLAMSTIYSNLETIQFIELLGTNKNIKWKYEICLELSPFSNNIKILQYFSAKVIEIIDSKIIKNIFVSGYASFLGHIDMIEWISSTTPFSFINTHPYTRYCIDVAAWGGHLEMIKWLHFNRTEGCSTNAMDYAAQNGYLETIKWLHENRTEGCTVDAMDSAAGNGNLETIKWLHGNRTEGCTSWAMDYAAGNGNLETIKWLHENRTEGCTSDAMDNAAQNDHLDIVQWLHYNRTEGCTTNAMECAALNGNLEIIIWLHENRTEGCTSNAMDYAAQNGHLDIVQWLHFSRTEGRVANAKEIANDNNHIEVYKWLNSLELSNINK